MQIALYHFKALVGLSIVVFACYGWCSFLMSRLNIRALHALPLSFAIISSILVFAGILNIILVAHICILLFGITALFKYRRRQPRLLPSVCYLATVFLIALTCKGRTYVHPDDYSHWGVIVKSMLLTDRLPNFLDTVIKYQTYPPGSAAFAYFCSRFSYQSESYIILSHVILELTFLLPILDTHFKSDRSEKVIKCIAGIGWVYSFLLGATYKEYHYTLLVDLLLGCIAYSCISVLQAEYNEGVKFKCLLVYMVYIPLIKQSGIFLALLILLFYYLSNHAESARTHKKYYLCCIVVSCSVFYIWYAHTKYVFPEPESTEQALSFSRYYSIVSEKDWSVVYSTALQIIQDLMKDRVTFIIAGQVLLYLIVVFAWNRENKSDHLRWLIGLLMLYMLYVCGIFVMYLISMSSGVATRAYQLDRYLSTINLLASGLLFAKTADLSTSRAITLVMCSVMVATVFFGMRSLNIKGIAYTPNKWRLVAEKVIDEYKINESSNVMVLSKWVQPGTILKYLLWNDLGTSKDYKRIDEYDIIILADPSDGQIDFLQSDNWFNRKVIIYMQ